MTATKQLLPSAERGRRRWLIAGALVALAPKCVLCVAAYAGAAFALGRALPDLCGASSEPPSHLAWLFPAAGAVLIGVGLLASRRRGQAG
jgi:MYXO-CTERM domain-containing protein